MQRPRPVLQIVTTVVNKLILYLVTDNQPERDIVIFKSLGYKLVTRTYLAIQYSQSLIITLYVLP